MLICSLAYGSADHNNAAADLTFYGGVISVSQTALAKWIKQYSTVETEDGDVLTAKQIKEMQKRMAHLEEENLIQKKAIAIFMPHSHID